MPDLDSLSPDQRLALLTAAKVLQTSSPGRSRWRPSRCSCTRATTSSPTGRSSRTSCR